MKTSLGILLILGAALIAPGFSQTKWTLPPEDIKFKVAPGYEITTASCILCHSVDYIVTQPPLDRTAWGAIVQKMREKYGAPIPTNKVDEIVSYLTSNYGRPPKKAN